MKAKLIFLGVFLLLILGGITYDLWHTPTPIAKNKDEILLQVKDAPKFEFETLAGKKFSSLSKLAEENIILNFWASWCVTCVVELPAMLNLVNKSNGKLALVAVSIDDKKSQMQKFLRKLNSQTKGLVTHKNVYWVWDKNKEISLNKFNVLRVPETIIINKNRQMIRKIVGEFNWEDFTI